MNTPSTGFAVPQEETVVVVETSSIKINKEKQKLYSVDKAYESLKLSIQHFGIKEPLIVEKGTNIVISGNRRLKVAIELKIATIPVIFRELNEKPKDKSVVYVTHEIQREKTYSQYLAEYRILQQKFPLTQGARTDLKQVEKLNAEALRVLSGLSRTTLYYLLEIDRMAIEKYKDGKDSKSYKNIWNDLDEGYKTPKYWYDRLNPKTKEDKKKVVPTLPPMLLDYCQVLNRSCDDLSCIEDNSVSCFMSSPPNWKGKNKSVVTGDIPLGDESDSDEYLDKLVDTYKKALRKLKKGGSIWVNLSDVVVDGEYVIIPHRFVLKMQKIGLVLNDELIWVKKSPSENVKRTNRGFEYVFQFVRKDDKRGFYYDKSWLSGADSLKFLVAKAGGEFEEKNTTSSFDFRDGVVKTASPNIQKLRRACKSKGLDFDNDSTFPIDLAMFPILLTTRKGETVVDLFGGVGTVALVAGALGRKSITFEVNPDYYKVAQMRLTEIVSTWESSDFNEVDVPSLSENEIFSAA
jgi:site-specific DNA-methyltransferase (adenine-specific)